MKGGFVGWRGDFQGFFLGLRANNTKEYFDAHRPGRCRGPVQDGDADRSGTELARIVGALRKKGYEIGGQELERVPPPYAKDHPRAKLLLHKRLIYWRRWEIEPWIATAKVRERVAAVWRDGATLESWMSAHVAGTGPASGSRYPGPEG